ncbi:hypothetical protein BDA96_01G254000 [Sorghum bicolor]|uniref:SHSP domain-containing protein n=1 Tax=Sorghum bicolor TaxID=4558 RepID=A0A921UZU0_SORBI|nr:hypothetical protein BDA96_01G254000 [Sorghum bicolor]
MASSERVYEDFVPPHQMEREPATHTLTVNLSAQGYKKEHIRVQMVHSHRRLIVRGERPVDDGNRWSRFRLELRVPDGCDAKAIHAKFDNGVVRVTMPGVQPEPVPVVASTGQQQQQQESPSPLPLPSPLPKQPSTAAVAGDGVQDRKGAAEQDGGDRDRAARGHELDKRETPRKQEARQRVLSSSAKDAGGGGSSGSSDDDTVGGVGEVTAAASLSSRQGYGFLHNRKMTTTVLGVVLVLISFGIYVKYSLWP